MREEEFKCQGSFLGGVGFCWLVFGVFLVGFFIFIFFSGASFCQL